MKQYAIILGLGIAIHGSSAVANAETASTFKTKILPLLESHCTKCHGPEKQEGVLRLDSIDAAKIGGDQGPAIVPGDVEKSLLVKAISFRDRPLSYMAFAVITVFWFFIWSSCHEKSKQILHRREI